jgi:hypothetical protein
MRPTVMGRQKRRALDAELNDFGTSRTSRRTRKIDGLMVM